VHPEVLEAPPDVLAGLLAHEVAHLDGRHAGRGALLDAALCGVAVVVDGWVYRSTGKLVPALLILVAALLLIRVVRQAQSRRQELDADRRAVGLLQRTGLAAGPRDAAAMVAAAVRWCAARGLVPHRERLMNLMDRRPRWLRMLRNAGYALAATHPSTQRRLRQLDI
jgi:Zn-dependent protease with chaperone function